MCVSVCYIFVSCHDTQLAFLKNKLYDKLIKRKCKGSACCVPYTQCRLFRRKDVVENNYQSREIITSRGFISNPVLFLELIFNWLYQGSESIFTWVTRLRYLVWLKFVLSCRKNLKGTIFFFKLTFFIGTFKHKTPQRHLEHLYSQNISTVFTSGFLTK